MNPGWQPYREPLSATLLRTGAIALVIGCVLARISGGISALPTAILLGLWPSFGGHWVELWFLNWLRPRLSSGALVQISFRVGTWFVAGACFTPCMHLTAITLGGFRPRHWPAWWLGGIAFIGIELAAHIALRLRGRPSFYNARG